MRKILIKSDSLEMWMHQNEASYTGDFFDGVLLDNFIVSCKNGIAAVYEHALNEWSSCYEIHFSRYRKQSQIIYDEFYQLESEVLKCINC